MASTKFATLRQTEQGKKMPSLMLSAFITILLLNIFD